MTEKIKGTDIKTREEIIETFPPQPEESLVNVTIDKKRVPAQVDSMVSRNREGVIVYVVPGSIQFRDQSLAARIKNTPTEE